MRNIFILLAGIFITTYTWAQDVKWIIMARGGSAYNFKTPLIIKQNEHKNIRMTAEYATRPFATPPYYDLHVVRWDQTKGWGLKITHHKLYLTNNTPEVQRFTITDGYNLITVTRQWKIAGFIYHLGGGAVFTHPESIIRGLQFSETEGIFQTGYHLSGPVAETALEKRIDLSRRLLLSLEGRITASYVKVPIAHGHARTSNVAFHGLAGIGYTIYGKHKD